MTTEQQEITAKDDVSSRSDDDKAGRGDDISSSSEDDKVAKKEDPLMNASDVINSMRSAIEDSLRNIEPPMPFFQRPKQRQHWGDTQVRGFDHFLSPLFLLLFRDVFLN